METWIEFVCDHIAVLAERVMTLNCDHSPFYSAPESLVIALQDIAE